MPSDPQETGTEQLEPSQQPPEDPDRMKPCGGCGGTLAWDESAGEWYHEESIEKIEKRMRTARSSLEDLDGDEVVVIGGTTGPVYARRVGADEFDAVYSGASGLTEREAESDIRWLMQARGFAVIDGASTPLGVVEE